MSDSRTFSSWEVRAHLQGFQERQRAREKEREAQKDYCRKYSATRRAQAKKARAQHATAPSVPSGPLRIVPQFPTRTNPTIPVWPDASAARHSA
jgi:hypothetical protein